MGVDADFLSFVAVGFLAQLVDGALGMAFGVISTSALVMLGVPPAAASAGVHTVETVTTAVSGTSHAIARNIDWKLFGRIAIPGILGAVAGGFLDAAGGGGWGPIVTSNLLVQGKSPRHTVGTVNAAEFLVTTSAAITFIWHLGWEVVTTATLGLLAGGVIAAPFGAILAKRLKPDLLMTLVGAVLILTSAFGIWRYFA